MCTEVKQEKENEVELLCTQENVAIKAAKNIHTSPL